MLYYIIVNKFGSIASFVFMLALILIFAACGQKSSEQDKAGDRKDFATESIKSGYNKIKMIDTAESSASFVVSITGSRRLAYTSIKQPKPIALVLYFPNTGLGMDHTDIMIGGDLIKTIKAVEIVEGGPSKVVIALNKDIPYQISQENDGAVLKVSFSRSTS